jgi:hypothetical protein
MTPLEELQAAHKRLTTLQKNGAVGPWRTSQYNRMMPTRVLEYEEGGEVAIVPIEEDADLICALHRTIDAQLMMLSAAKAYLARVDADETLVHAEVELARAINGEAS